MSQTEPSPRPEPVFRSPKAVLALIGVLVTIHLILWWAGDAWRTWAIAVFALIPVRLGGGPPIAMVSGSQYWSLLTYAFLHNDIVHLLSNSLWLLIFGTLVARYLGASRFLMLYAISAVAGGLAMVALHWGSGDIVIGASGAVSGLMAGAVPIMYGHGMLWGTPLAGDSAHATALCPRELFQSRGAMAFMILFGMMTLATGDGGYISNSFMGEVRIAWEAHLGGFVAGLAAFYWLAAFRT